MNTEGVSNGGGVFQGWDYSPVYTRCLNPFRISGKTKPHMCKRSTPDCKQVM